MRAGGEQAIALTRGRPRSAAERHWAPAAGAGAGAAGAPESLEVAGRANATAFAGVSAVVHLAGATLASRWTAARRRAIRSSRVDATRALVGALAGLDERPRVLVSASAVGIYGDRGDEVLTEASEPGRGFLAEVGRGWEDEAERAEGLGVRVVRLRFGIVLGPGGGVLGPLVPLFRLGLGGAPGNGRQWWSWIALPDAIALIRRALGDASLRGAVNAVSPCPERAGDFARTLGRVLRRPAVVPAPAAMLRVFLGAMADEMLLASQRARPARLIDLGFEFRHAPLESAIRTACQS